MIYVQSLFAAMYNSKKGDVWSQKPNITFFFPNRILQLLYVSNVPILSYWKSPQGVFFLVSVLVFKFQFVVLYDVGEGHCPSPTMEPYDKHQFMY